MRDGFSRARSRLTCRSSTKVDFVIILKTANRLRLEIPPNGRGRRRGDRVSHAPAFRPPLEDENRRKLLRAWL